MQTACAFFLWKDHPERPPCSQTISRPRAVVRPGDAQERRSIQSPLGAGHVGTSAWHTPEPQTPQSKAGARHKPDRAYSLVTRKPPCHLGSLCCWCRNSLEAVFPDTAQPNLQAGPSKSSSSGPPA